jgi:chemotaxis protein MotB
MVRRRRRRSGGDQEEHADERWLLTYADLITLLMALFMVLFSMSVVNKSKLASLQQSLKEGFKPKILPGGQSIKHTSGETQVQKIAPASPAGHATQQINKAALAASAAAAEQEQLRRLQIAVEAQASKLGLHDKVTTHVTRRGLVIDILTDNLLFNSGAAQIKPAGLRLLDHLAPVLHKQAGSHRVVVEGHTDSIPIKGSLYPSNWELSTARASAVVRALITMRLPPGRMEASGRAYLQPTASNATETGRAHNRRVEIVLPRRGS